MNAQLKRLYAKHRDSDHPILTKLRKGDGRFVPGVGPVPARVMFVGEAPGESESNTGQPFCGPAGSVLNGWLSLAGLHREDVFITNAVKFRPTDRDGRNRTPRVGELAVSRDLLAAEATVVSPEWIVCLGATAVKALWSQSVALQPTPNMADAHGQMYSRYGRKVYVMYHPAAVLHDESKLDTGVADALEFGRLLGNVHNGQ